MIDTIRKRLEALEAMRNRDPCFCLVELPDGTQTETTLEEWYAHWHEWRWLRMTRGGDNNDVFLLFAAWDESSGDLDAARQDEAEYRRRSR
jgi:hypothetical protein